MKHLRREKKKETYRRRPAGITACLLPVLLAVLLVLGGCTANSDDFSSGEYSSGDASAESALKAASAGGSLVLGGGSTLSEGRIPIYNGEPYTEIDGNVPSFDESDFSASSFETYSDLDELGRCGPAFANVGRDLMPTEERGSIGQVKPSGWHTVKYDSVDGKYLYNRCHLIGYQLTAENANRENLITGTRYFNAEGMLPFENMVADYVKETGNHVLYRVTPVFEGDNLVASGVQIEACSTEDRGKDLSFNVFVFNIQPGISIDYATGDSRLSDGSGRSGASNGSSSGSSGGSGGSGGSGSSGSTVSASDYSGGSSNAQGVIRGNSRSKIYHCPGQADYEEMADSKYLVVFRTEQEAINAGYRKAKR